MIHTDLIAPIGALLERHAASQPNRVAFSDKHRAVTYAALRDRTAALACHLQSLGINPGERVGLMLPNSVDWIEACLAILRAGAVAVPISADATSTERDYRLDNANCVACFAGPARAADIKRDRIIIGDGNGAAAASNPPSRPRDPGDLKQPAFILYTSGTTGQPKGVTLTLHGMLWVAAACWAPIAGLNQTDRVLSALPLYHSYALNLTVIAIIATGASQHLMEHFSTTETLHHLQTGDFTLLPAVPTVFHYLLNTARAENTKIAAPLRLCLSAGAILAGTLNRDFEDFFNVTLLDGYGITETSTMVTLNWPTGTRIMGSCGLPVPGLSVRLLDPATGEDAAAGQEGELIVRGPNVMLGYHDNPAATANVLRNGWYHTGDLARQDENAYLTITGRLKEIIIRGGQNIAPAEVEETICTHPSVLDCAVVGIPHPLLGEVPAAFVVLRDGTTLDADTLAAHCRAKISSYKLPAALHLVEKIPRTGSGKIMRYRLLEGL